MPITSGIPLDILLRNKYIDSAVNLVKPEKPFLLDKVFKKVKKVPSIYVQMEEIDATIKIANFTSQNAAIPNKVAGSKRTGKYLELPHIFEEYDFTIEQITNMDNILTGNGTQKSKDEYVKEVMTEASATLINRRKRLFELAAVQSVTTGVFDYKTNAYEMKIDYNFVEGKQIITLTGDDKWDAETAPNIENQWDSFKRACIGANVALFSTTGISKFKQNTSINEALKNTNKLTGALDNTGIATESVLFHGRYGGVDIYEYLDVYENKLSVESKYWPEDTVVFINTNREFVQYSGQVLRFNDKHQLVKSMNQDNIFVPEQDKYGRLISWVNETRGIPAIKDKRGVLAVKII